MNGHKNSTGSISDDLVYEWVRFFKGQVYEWSRLRNTGSHTRTKIIPKLPPPPSAPSPIPFLNKVWDRNKTDKGIVPKARIGLTHLNQVDSPTSTFSNRMGVWFVFIITMFFSKFLYLMQTV